MRVLRPFDQVKLAPRVPRTPSLPRVPRTGYREFVHIP